MKTVLSVLTGLVICWTALAEPMTPMQALQGPIDQVIRILKGPQYREASQEGSQQERIRTVIDEIFDFDAIARLSVGRHWKRFAPEEKASFADSFAKLLSNSYIERMQGEFENEEVIYLAQERKSSSKSLVKTEIARETKRIPVDYSMRLRSDGWRVYDVKVEGISLVKNYRTQFSRILFKETPAALIERVNRKVEKLGDRKTEKRE